MPHVPVLRVVPLESIRRHEEVDPLRVERLQNRISAEGMQVNPMVCIEAPGGELVLLDGATRTETLKRIGLSLAVVQIVEPHSVELSTWHHVVRECTPEELLALVEASQELEMNDNYGTPSIHPNEGRSRLVTGANGMSENATLSALVRTYIGRWRVTRTTDPRREHVATSYPGWAAIIEFPLLTVDDVMAAAVGNDLLPAGVTRFLVPNRALRLNVPLEHLGANSVAAAQASLNRLLEERASEGRIRRYEGPIFILDD
jgi:L-serine kinase (ATP) / ParB family transcriptional regulator, heme-responsive regulator